jgi:signal transduction histidine kinase
MAQSIATDTTLRQGAERISPESGWQAVKRLRWFTTLVPASGVFFFETVRHTFLEHSLPMWQGNLVAALLALTLAFVFSEVVLRTVEHLHQRSLADQEELTYLNAIVQERERLSRELHDGLAQVVSYLLLRLDTVEELVKNHREDEACAELASLRALTDDLYADVRESISGLRSRVVELGLRRALEEYIGEFEERHSITVAFTAPLTVKVLPSVDLQIFRIAQEALANVRKHSGASHCEVTISYPWSGELELVVSDDGRGFDPSLIQADTSGTFGLTGMRERAEALGGETQFISKVGGGTRVVVRIPVRDQPAARHEALAPAAS